MELPRRWLDGCNLATDWSPSYGLVKKVEFSQAVGFLVAKRLAVIQANIWECRSGARIFERPVVPERVTTSQSVANACLTMMLYRNWPQTLQDQQWHGM